MIALRRLIGPSELASLQEARAVMQCASHAHVIFHGVERKIHSTTHTTTRLHEP